MIQLNLYILVACMDKAETHKAENAEYYTIWS